MYTGSIDLIVCVREYVSSAPHGEFRASNMGNLGYHRDPGIRASSNRAFQAVKKEGSRGNMSEGGREGGMEAGTDASREEGRHAGKVWHARRQDGKSDSAHLVV